MAVAHGSRVSPRSLSSPSKSNTAEKTTQSPRRILPRLGLERFTDRNAAIL